MKETLAKIEQAIDNDKQLLHVGVNASHIVAVQKDLELFTSSLDIGPPTICSVALMFF